MAAGAVVSRDVPDDTLVAGNPAQVVRELVYPDGVTRAWHDTGEGTTAVITPAASHDVAHAYTSTFT